MKDRSSQPPVRPMTEGPMNPGPGRKPTKQDARTRSRPWRPDPVRDQTASTSGLTRALKERK